MYPKCIFINFMYMELSQRYSLDTKFVIKSVLYPICIFNFGHIDNYKYIGCWYQQLFFQSSSHFLFSIFFLYLDLQSYVLLITASLQQGGTDPQGFRPSLNESPLRGSSIITSCLWHIYASSMGKSHTFRLAQQNFQIPTHPHVLRNY